MNKQLTISYDEYQGLIKKVSSLEELLEEKSENMVLVSHMYVGESYYSWDKKGDIEHKIKLSEESRYDTDRNNLWNEMSQLENELSWVKSQYNNKSLFDCITKKKLAPRPKYLFTTVDD